MEQTGSTFGTTLAYRKKMPYLCTVEVKDAAESFP